MRYSALGHDEFSDIRRVADFQVVEIDHEDLDDNFEYTIPIPKETLVLGVGVLVTEALSGGAATMTVGDSSADDAWATSALIVPGTISHFYYSGGSSVSLAQAKYFATAGYIRVHCATGLTAGTVKVLIHSFNLEASYRESL